MQPKPKMVNRYRAELSFHGSDGSGTVTITHSSPQGLEQLIKRLYPGTNLRFDRETSDTTVSIFDNANANQYVGNIVECEVPESWSVQHLIATRNASPQGGAKTERAA